MVTGEGLALNLRPAPLPTVISARPSVATASNRGRRPGATQAQKIRSPAVPAMKMAVSSMNPCGRMYRKKGSSSPWEAIIPPVIPNATSCVAIQALLVHT